MRLRVFFLLFMFMAAVTVGFATDLGPVQDQEVLRFAKRAFAWFPDSKFSIVKDEVFQTPAGDYRVVAVERQCLVLTGGLKPHGAADASIE